MPQPQITYQQILRELQAQGQMPPPQPMPSLSPSPTPYPYAAPDPMAMAERRAKLMQAMGQMSNMANPETEMAQKGQAPKPGLIQLLMGLLK